MKEAKKSGKKLEKLISMIQESLKDSPYTVIHSNYKIPNVSGRKREIDVLIESKINDISIRIAIECKEYSKPVSVEKIEAFKGKCDRIIDINKKIFVSQNGYQVDAINAAKDFGIDLYTVEEINTETIKDWFPTINQLGLRFSLNHITIYLDNNDDNLNSQTKDGMFHFYDGKHSEPIKEFANTLLKDNGKFIWDITLLDFFKRGCKDPEKLISIPFEMAFKKGIYVIDTDDEQTSVLGIASSIDAWLLESNAVIEESNALVTLDGEVKANNIAIPIGESKANIIISKDKYSIFHTDENGVTAELKTLMTFNPNQDSRP